jgi:hypothetical protein
MWGIFLWHSDTKRGYPSLQKIPLKSGFSGIGYGGGTRAESRTNPSNIGEFPIVPLMLSISLQMEEYSLGDRISSSSSPSHP